MCFESFPGTLYTALEGLCRKLSQFQIAEVPSITPMRGTTKCEFCKKREAECSGFTHSQDAESDSNCVIVLARWSDPRKCRIIHAIINPSVGRTRKMMLRAST